MKKRCWYLYIIQTEKGHLYTGITTDIERRFKEHSSGKKGAKYFRTAGPVEILFKKKFADRSSASKAESFVKSLKRSQKEEIIKTRKLKVPSTQKS